MRTLELTGSTLTAGALGIALEQGYAIALSASGLERMRAARQVIAQAVAERRPLYGVTTGLGSRVTQSLSAEALAAFSYDTLRGRAQAAGPPLPREVVRAAMVLRANGLLLGASGAAPEIADHLVACLNAGLTPCVPGLGSIGPADLLPGGSFGLALIGEGEMMDGQGRIAPAAQLMEAAGIAPPQLGPRDGLALCSHTSFATAYTALAVLRARRYLDCGLAAAALSVEAFRANLTPLRADALAFRSQGGDAAVASALRALLEGSLLFDTRQARRLQDPLSFRSIVQIQGTLQAALDSATAIVEAEMNGAADNPAVIAESGEAISTGNFHNPHILLACDALARGVSLSAAAQAGRIAKHMISRFSELPLYLAEDTATSNGYAPFLKLAESLLARMQADATPAPIWPSMSADGVEDCLTNAMEAGRRAYALAEPAFLLTALELAVAAEAAEQRGIAADLPPRVAGIYAFVRERAEPLRTQRSLSKELERLAADLAAGQLQHSLA